MLATLCEITELSVHWHEWFSCYAPTKSKLQHPTPPPPGIPGIPGQTQGHLTIFCARGVEKLICKAFPGMEI